MEGIHLGDRVWDSLTPCHGVVVAATQYLHDRPSFAVQPPSVNEKGQPADWVWLTEGRLVTSAPAQKVPD